MPLPSGFAAAYTAGRSRSSTSWHRRKGPARLVGGIPQTLARCVPTRGIATALHEGPGRRAIWRRCARRVTFKNALRIAPSPRSPSPQGKAPMAHLSGDISTFAARDHSAIAHLIHLMNGLIRGIDIAAHIWVQVSHAQGTCLVKAGQRSLRLELWQTGQSPRAGRLTRHFVDDHWESKARSRSNRARCLIQTALMRDFLSGMHAPMRLPVNAPHNTLCHPTSARPFN